ncbi:hypothetical protein IKF15_02985 [Candidatus Saccharibacteria bacterium]|nr:hypothetical protein [Candidatus Saccharibacteria bacterium]
MFEISLVPDVKSELLKKQKLRNLIIFICVVVAAACGGLLATLGLIVGAQKLTIANNKTEITCRSEGASGDVKCDSNKFGIAIAKYDSVEDLLTIQDQMSKLNSINEKRKAIWRVFGLLDVMLPDGPDDTVKITELTTDLTGESTISFEANASSSNNIGFRAVDAFIKNAGKSYYDHGAYKRVDGESFVDIPSMCIVREVVIDDKIYGLYAKGAPGCEAPYFKEEKSSTEKEEGEEEEVTFGEDENELENVEWIAIKRTYVNEKDRECTMREGGKECEVFNSEGVDFGSDEITLKKGYYFESECLKYDENGELDEEETKNACPMLRPESEIETGEATYGKDEDTGARVVNFSATVPVNPEIFLASNKHLQIKGPTRQNATDSYVQIRDMFTQKAEKIEGEVENGK